MSPSEQALTDAANIAANRVTWKINPHDSPGWHPRWRVCWYWNTETAKNQHVFHLIEHIMLRFFAVNKKTGEKIATDVVINQDYYNGIYTIDPRDYSRVWGQPEDLDDLIEACVQGLTMVFNSLDE